MIRTELISNIHKYETDWVDVPQFKNKLVANGYEIVQKKEQRFSLSLRIGRIFLGMLAFAFSLGLALWKKEWGVRKLFTKTKESVYFIDQKKLKSEFEKTYSDSTRYVGEVYEPLFLKAQSLCKPVNSPEFFKQCTIIFTKQGFDVLKRGYKCPDIMLRTVKFICELGKKISTQANLSYTKDSVDHFFRKPLFKYIQSQEIYREEPRIQEVIQNYKTWVQQYLNNTIVPASGLVIFPNRTASFKNSSVTLLENPPLPDEHPISEVDKEAWIDLHSEDDKKVARKFIKNITYISSKSFLDRLEMSVNSFKKKIGGKAYVMVVPDAYHKKSNFWVSSLASKFLGDRAPAQIITLSEVANHSCNNIAIFDDAAYSGKQMHEFLYQVRKASREKDLNLYLVVPFMTNRAYRDFAPNTWIAEHQRIYGIWEIFKDNERKVISRQPYGSEGSLTITYFAHKIADYMSVHESLREGRLLGNPKKRQYLRFIEEFVEPYKQAS